MSDETPEPTVRELRDAVREFVRLFGLLDEHQTPCGESLRVPHAHALMVLYERRDDRAPRISELGRRLSIDKGNVSRLCRRMDEQGHIDLRSCPDDGRAKRVDLTDEGRTVAARVEESSLARFEDVSAALDGPAPDDVVEAVDALNDALRQLSSESKASETEGVTDE